MKDDSFIPAPFLESTTEVYASKVGKTSSIIYLIVCFSFVLACASLVFIRIPISVSSQAVIRPSSEITIIRSPVTGIVKQSVARENLSVKKAELLFRIESEIQREKEKQLTVKKTELSQFVSDLSALLNGKSPEVLVTSLYKQSWFSYKQKINDASTRLNKMQVDFDRNNKLHLANVIADAEFESFVFELNKAKNELELTRQSHLTQWENESRNLKIEIQELDNQLGQLATEFENMTVKAPISGTIQNTSGVYPGSVVFVNQELAQISPDTSLIVEAYVRPDDIGLIQNGMPARFQVTAFNYNQWGFATGSVLEVSSDIQLINDQPVFKARCQLDKNFLQLKNGYKGFLKKGMIVQARFMITERTLWQLIYDKADDWLNPGTFTQ
jgi:multidrug resistance efflux pump